jgi:hypothetical protein
MKWKNYLIILSACLLAGCSSDSGPVFFSNGHFQQPEDSTIPVASEPNKLSKQDLFKVELAVFGYMLQRHFWDGGDYSAIFLQGPDDEVDAVIKQFPKHIPPIKTSDRAQLISNHAPVDRDTGKPAMILSVDTLDPEGNMVQAIGKWYAGSAVSGFYTFSLEKSDGDWVIRNSE